MFQKSGFISSERFKLKMALLSIVNVEILFLKKFLGKDESIGLKE